ncbi:MAG: hypothetical protein P1V36_16145 [Planctomycetota bacterium]|nr:hypothetical protein [Planctomycetota bacterium]
MNPLKGSFLAVFLVGMGVLAVGCRATCRPLCCEGAAPVPEHASSGPTVTADAPAVAEKRGDAPQKERDRLFLRYFDVKDFNAGSGDVLLHGVRTQVLPEVWEREPGANMEFHNGILVVRAPVRLLDAVGDWVSETRAGIKQVHRDLAERAEHARTLVSPRVTHEKDRSGLVVQIHPVAQLTSARAEQDTDLLLSGPDDAPTTIRKGEGVPVAAVVSGIETAKTSGSWLGAESAIVRASGEHSLVVKGTREFQVAVDRHIKGLMEQFGAGLAEPSPPPPAPVKAVPPPKDEPDK